MSSFRLSRILAVALVLMGCCLFPGSAAFGHGLVIDPNGVAGTTTQFHGIEIDPHGLISAGTNHGIDIDPNGLDGTMLGHGPFVDPDGSTLTAH